MAFDWTAAEMLLKGAALDSDAQTKLSNAQLVEELVHVADALQKVAGSGDDGPALDKSLKEIFSGEDTNLQDQKTREAIKNRIMQLGMIAAPSM